MPKSETHEFLRKFDRWGQPVGLTYKGSPNYTTPIGGCFTIFGFLLFMTWLIMEMLDVYMPPGKHNVSTADTIT